MRPDDAAEQGGWEWHYLRSRCRIRLSLNADCGVFSSLDWSPNGHRLASGAEDTTVRIWDIATNKVILVLEGHTQPVAAVTWSRDGRILAERSGNTSLVLCNTTTGKDVLHLNGRDTRHLAWSPDSQHLVTVGNEEPKLLLKVWPAECLLVGWTHKDSLLLFEEFSPGDYGVGRHGQGVAPRERPGTLDAPGKCPRCGL